MRAVHESYFVLFDGKLPSCANASLSRTPAGRTFMKKYGWLHVILLALSLGLIVDAILAPDLVTELRDASGRWSLYFLLVALSFTPVLHFRPKWRIHLVLRKYIGLWAFAYASFHVAVWVILEFNYDWSLMLQEISDNLFIWLGLISMVLLLLLAITSNQKSQRKYGFKAWQLLHQSIYPATGLALSHYLMAQKLVEWQPVLLMMIFAIVMVWRFRHAD